VPAGYSTIQEGTSPLAATAPPLRTLEREEPSTAEDLVRENRQGLLAASVLTILVVLMQGYHPYAEDGGLYLAGIKRVLHPDLYPYWSGFTTAHLRFSLFAPMVALLVRVTHLSLMRVMLLVYLASLWATVYAVWQLARRCYSETEARYGGTAFVALLLGVPVAGTSLMLMDPYVSARSISTPCGLFALVAIIDTARQINHGERVAMSSILVCLGSLSLAALVHPLMAAYALGWVLVLATALLIGRQLQWAVYGLFGLIAIIAAAVLIRFSPMPPSGYIDVARTRAYWFLGYWHWYEIAGLAAPLIVVAAISFHQKNKLDNIVKSLARTGFVVGVLSLVVAMLFARPGMASYAVARLQPLRIFQTVYVITILVVGAGLGKFVLKRGIWRWTLMITSLGAIMLYAQLQLFPSSDHFEFPWLAPANGWEQAFLWIKSHTSHDAVIALDADYITSRGEDAQNFRAIAERSAIPDYSKDGGIASIAPDLTADWMRGESVQKGLNDETDAERMAALRAAHADWVILSSGATTGLACEYTNDAAKICRVSDPRAHDKSHAQLYPPYAFKQNVAHQPNRSTSRH
jgi:hypothetical protein